MDWLTFFSGLVAALVWPAVLLLALLLFHEPIRKLIPKLQQVEVAGFKATLEKAGESADKAGKAPDFTMTMVTFDVNALLDEEDELPEPPVLTVPAVAEVPVAERQVAASNPRMGIDGAWMMVEHAAHACAGRLKAAFPRSSNPLDPEGPAADLMGALEAIQARARAPVALYALVFQLRALQAQAAQAAPESISADEALAYQKLAWRAIAAFSREGAA